MQTSNADNGIISGGGDGRPPLVFIETYGCQMNVADTELIRGILRDAGYGVATTAETADVILVNTCAVRENAERRVWGRLANLGHLKRARPELVLGVTGCMAKHVGDRLAAEATAVDLLASPDAYRSLPRLIAAARDACQLDLHLDRGEHYLGIDPVRSPGVGGWVTIMRGCDKFCSFCIVPYVRGRERGVPATEVVRQVEELARVGYREVTLLGQTVNSYRHDTVTFAELLERVANVDGIRRIRFTSPHPNDFDRRTLEVMAAHDNIMEHLHLPVQSGADRVLAAMQRDYTAGDFLRLVDEMRTAMPEITLTTDLMVGFPGETEAEFAATLELVRTVQFESAFMFAYSERPGTGAARELPDTLSQAEKVERLQQLVDLQESIAAVRNRAWVGRQVEVLVEGPSRRDPGRWYGKTEQAKTVIFPAGDARAGELVQLRIDDSTSHTLFSGLERSLAEGSVTPAAARRPDADALQIDGERLGG